MTARRQEKVARVIKESVSTTLLTRLSDPRIQGLVTVTEVDVSPDMKQAVVHLSVLGVNPAAQQLTLTAIRHAARCDSGCPWEGDDQPVCAASAV